MSKRQLILLLSVWSILFLFLGFPFFWDKVIAVITGLCIGILVYTLPTVEVPGRSRQSSSSDHNEHQSYKEHRAVPQTSMDSTSAPHDFVTTE